jgi:hypothetical protein
MAKKKIEEVVDITIVENATEEVVLNQVPVEKQNPGHNTRAFRQ